MVNKNYVNKLGSTAATQGATKSMENQKKQSIGFVEGAGKTFTAKKGFGGFKSKNAE